MDEDDVREALESAAFNDKGNGGFVRSPATASRKDIRAFAKRVMFFLSAIDDDMTVLQLRDFVTDVAGDQR